MVWLMLIHPCFLCIDCLLIILHSQTLNKVNDSEKMWCMLIDINSLYAYRTTWVFGGFFAFCMKLMMLQH